MGDRSAVNLGFAFLVGLFTGYVLFASRSNNKSLANSSTSSQSSSSTSTDSTGSGKERITATEDAWVLAVTVTFADEATKAEFKKLFEPLALYVATHEPETLTYIVSESDQEPLKVLITERYKNKETSYLQVHKSSDEFLSFRSKVTEMEKSKRLEMKGNSWKEIGLGYALG